jgi:N-acetylneuraminic acid mutarotase
LNGHENNLPKTRDEHTAVLHGETMVIFGGFSYGDRTNELFRFHFESNQWERLVSPSENQPCRRAGASSVSFGDHMYLFGGKDDESTTLNDLWKLNLTTFEWTQISTKQTPPTARSGHSA